MGRGSPFRADISTSGLTGPSNCPSNSHPLGAPNLSWFQRSTTQVTFNHIPRVRRTYCVAVRTELPPFAQGSAQHTTSPPPAAFNACAFQRSLFEFARQPAQRRNPLRHHRHQRRHRISPLHRLVRVLLLVLLLVDIRCPLSPAHSIIRHPNSATATNIASILLQYLPQPTTHTPSLSRLLRRLPGNLGRRHIWGRTKKTPNTAVSLTQSACIHSSNHRHPPASSASHETISPDWRITRLSLQCVVDPCPTRPRSRCRFDHFSTATSLLLPASLHCRRPALTSV